MHCATDQNSSSSFVGAFTLRHQSSGMRPSCLPPLNIHPYLLTYLLTYLLWSGTGPKTEGAGREKIRWSGAGVGARVAPSRERIAVSGVTERGVSGEQKFPPLLLRSHHMLWSVSEITCSWHSTVLACDVLWVTSLLPWNLDACGRYCC